MRKEINIGPFFHNQWQVGNFFALEVRKSKSDGVFGLVLGKTYFGRGFEWAFDF
jgi:hypothetical protein